MLVAIRFISIGENSKKGLKEDRSEKEKKKKRKGISFERLQHSNCVGNRET